MKLFVWIVWMNSNSMRAFLPGYLIVMAAKLEDAQRMIVKHCLTYPESFEDPDAVFKDISKEPQVFDVPTVLMIPGSD